MTLREFLERLRARYSSTVEITIDAASGDVEIVIDHGYRNRSWYTFTGMQAADTLAEAELELACARLGVPRDLME